jgi:hypothetical protein
MQEIRTIYGEHNEFLTKIENARQQLWLIQKENLHHLSKDRQVDPWTQSCFDSIRTRCDQLKRDLSVLLQLTRCTIHDQSSPETTSDVENKYVNS